MRSRSRRRRRRSSGANTWTAGSPASEPRMKLATLKRHGRDGRLALVSRDLRRCLLVPEIAPTLQAALDDWSNVAPRLTERANALELSPDHPKAMPFDPAQCAAPLPRA